MKPLKSLLIYHLIPDELKFYEFDIDDPHLELIKKLNGIVINSDDLTDEQRDLFNQLDGEDSILMKKEALSHDQLNEFVFDGIYLISFVL